MLRGPERCPKCGDPKSASTPADVRDAVNTAAFPAWILVGIGLVLWCLVFPPSTLSLTDPEVRDLIPIGAPYLLWAIGFVGWRIVRKSETLHGARLVFALLLPWLTLVSPFAFWAIHIRFWG